MPVKVDHGSRDHDVWSASASARNLHCAGAMAMASVAPRPKGSVHAAQGTAGHQVGEKALRTGYEPYRYLGTTEETPEGPVEITEEIVDSVTMYVEYVRVASADGTLWLEERFSLAALKPPFAAGGTGDAIIYQPKLKRLEVVDFKHGRGVVQADGNPQLRTYGLGALLAHPDLDVDTIKVTIVQPRASHPKGRIRSETFSVGELVAWTQQLLEGMRRSAQASAEYEAVTGSISMEAWVEKWLQPGACKFCPAEGFCPALKRKAVELAGIRSRKLVERFFEAETPTVATITNEPALMSPEALAEVLDWADMLESWLNAVRALAHAKAERGETIPGYVLVEKHGNRKWAATDEKVIADLRNVVKLDDAAIFAEPKLRSPTQVEKALGAKRAKEIDCMWHKPVTGTNLVRADKTEREPIGSIADRYFEQPAA